MRGHLAWLLLALAGADAPAADTAEPRGFTFCAGKTDRAAPFRGEVEWSDPVVFGLLRALSEDQSKAFSSAVVDANTRWEARANPFLEDLEDGDPDESLGQWLELGPNAARTALAASSTHRCATDGWCVRVIARGRACPTGLTSLRSDAPELKRARFLAWSFGYASWLRARTEADAVDAARTLREAAGASQRIGLVLHVTDDEATRESARDLREALARREVVRRAALGQAGSGAPAEREAPSRPAFPAELDALDVVVLPRFEAVEDPASLEREVEAAAPKLRRVQ